MAFITIIEKDAADGELLNIFESLEKTRGKMAEVHKIQSLNPKTILSHMNLYMDVMYGKSPLKRYQREMMAVVVSIANECRYCTQHHSEALNHYWKDEETLGRFKSDFTSIELSSTDLALCNYARSITLHPAEKNSDLVDNLKQHGLSDREILDASLVVSYFNFVNRIVLSLGVELEPEAGKGYAY